MVAKSEDRSSWTWPIIPVPKLAQTPWGEPLAERVAPAVP